MAADFSNASDLDLLRLAAGEDGSAFHELVDRHADRLFALAMSLLRNVADAEDVVQETFTGAYRGLRQFEGRASVKTWLTRILFLQVAKFRRSRRGKMTQPIESAATSNATTASGEAGVDQRIDLRAAIATLSAEHQEVLLLREFEQLGYEDIAAVLNVPRGTVESRLFRARAELRAKLKVYR